MFKFNLQPVLNHRQFIEDSLQKAFAHLKGLLAKEQDRLVHYERQQQYLTEELVQKQRQGTTSSALLLYINFLDQLKSDLAQQQQKVAALENQIALKREELLDAMKDRKSLERFKEKKITEHRDLVSKKEQAFLDEIAINRHGRKQP
jgi:flagellar FliJ protein